nr:hypothetical protein [Tanacetum cinerariifolium]
MVLQDEEGNKIGATVKQSFYPKFKKALEEGKCVYISIFRVGDSEETLDNKYKINFYKFTNVTPCDTYSGPFYRFRFIMDEFM